MDNTIHFRNYNAGGQTATRWQESPFFIQLREKRLRRSQQMARDKQRRLAHQVLQRRILQLLIDAKQTPVPINQIAAQIGRSPQATARFLLTHADDLWIGVSGGRLLWMTSLRFLPDRLFH